MKRILLILFTLLMMTNLFAQSAEEAVNLLEDEQGFGIRAAGMGNAYTGVADDYSAIYWNPAGLAQLQAGEMFGSIYNLRFQNDATYLGTATDESRSYTKFQSLGMVFPFPVTQGSLVLALGYQRIKDLDGFLEFNGFNTASNNLGFEFEDYGVLAFDRDIQQKQTIESDGNLSNWSLGGAIDLSPNFSAGFTLNLYDGGSEYNLDYSQDDINAANSYDIFEDGLKVEEFYYNYYDFHQRISSNYSGFEAKLGGMFKMNENLRVGATMAFPMTLTVEEDWSSNDELSYDIVGADYVDEINEAYDLGEGVFDYEIKIPFKFGAGVSYQTRMFLLSAAADYRDWSQLKYEMPDERYSDDYVDILAQNKYFREDFQAVLSYSVGGELNLFNQSLSLRGGYRFVPSPLKDADAKYDKKYYSMGLGFRADRNTQIDLSYTVGNWEKDKYYSYDWDGDPMITSEKYTTSKFQIGARLFFR